MVLKEGFTLIEIMIVVVLIGIITAFGLPRFLSSPVPKAQEFIGRLNRLVMQAAEQAQQETEPRRIFFNLGLGSVEIQKIGGQQVGGKLELPKELEVTDVIINGVSQFQIGGGQKRTFYFLINAEGVSQEVQLVITEHARSGKNRPYEFYLHPFTSLFRAA